MYYVHTNQHEALWTVGRPGTPTGCPCLNLITGLDSPSRPSASFNTRPSTIERHVEECARQGYIGHCVISA